MEDRRGSHLVGRELKGDHKHMRFHEKFGAIHKGVLRQTQQLLQYNLADEPEEVVEKFDTWAAGVCEAYNLPVVRVELCECEALGGEGGSHIAENDVIVLTRPSLLVLFHQFRHHMQNHGRTHYSNREMDAHGWACSLLHKADPALFRRMVYEFAIPGVKMADLVGEAPAVLLSGQPDIVLDETERLVFEDIEETFIAGLGDTDADLTNLMEQIAGEEE